MKATSTPKKSTAEKEAMELFAEEKKYLSRFQNLLLQIPVAIAVFRGSNYLVELANAKALGIMVKDRSFIGKPLFEAMPELEHLVKEIFDKIMQSGIPFIANEIELTLFRNSKAETGWFNVNYQPIRDDDNSISGILATANEVTEQVLARNKIEDSEKRYNMILMKSPFGFAVLKSKNMVIDLANDSIKTFWGKGNDIEGKPLFEVLPELKDSSFPGLLDNVYTTGNPYYGEEILAPVLRDGKLEDVYFNFVYQAYQETDRTISGVTIIAYEVTAAVIVKKALEMQRVAEQKALKKIEESNTRYYTMLMQSPFAFSVLKGKDMVITLANDLMKEFWGKGLDVEGKTFLQVLPELKQQPFPEMINQVFTTGKPIYANEILARLQHDHKLQDKYFNIVYQPHYEADNSISGVTTIAYEVTEMVLARKKIEESEERFRSLADNMPIHIFIIEPNEEATISYWNKNWLDYTGQSFEEAIGNTWAGVMHPDDVQPIMEVYVPAFQKQQSYFLPAIRVRRHDGEYRWHSVQANPRYLPNGNYMGYIGVGFDIHEQKLAQDALKLSEEHFRLMADLMPAKISNADAAGHVTYFNKHWLTFSGYTFEELRDFGYHNIIHPDEMEEFQQRLKTAGETGTDSVMEMRFKNKEGDYIWHLNIASPVTDKNGKHIMWVGVTTEMQHQKEQREELEHEVAERTAALSTANEELKKMNKELEAFTYVSSHDLQEPLRKIRIMAERILEKENQNLSDNGKNYFRLMQNAAERMQTLIQDLLAFSRLSMADRKFENSNLNIIIEEVKKEFKDAIAEKNAVIEVKEICDVKIIPFQFRQLMHNLISNALKFSNPKIPPHIKISSVNITYSKINVLNLTPHKEYCHISFSDNGIGFEKEFAEKIFEVFQKLHAKDEYAGTGIGLAIVKKIIENHNGIILAKSKINIGTTFDIYIPA